MIGTESRRTDDDCRLLEKLILAALKTKDELACRVRIADISCHRSWHDPMFLSQFVAKTYGRDTPMECNSQKTISGRGHELLDVTNSDENCQLL